MIIFVLRIGTVIAPKCLTLNLLQYAHTIDRLQCSFSNFTRAHWSLRAFLFMFLLLGSYFL